MEKFLNPKLKRTLGNIATAAAESILSMSDEEISEEFRLLGLDEKKEAEAVRKIIKDTIAKVRQKLDFRGQPKLWQHEETGTMTWNMYKPSHRHYEVQTMHEDELPVNLDQQTYDWWFENSIVDFVRIGPNIREQNER